MESVLRFAKRLAVGLCLAGAAGSVQAQSHVDSAAAPDPLDMERSELVQLMQDTASVDTFRFSSQELTGSGSFLSNSFLQPQEVLSFITAHPMPDQDQRIETSVTGTFYDFNTLYNKEYSFGYRKRDAVVCMIDSTVLTDVTCVNVVGHVSIYGGDLYDTIENENDYFVIMRGDTPLCVLNYHSEALEPLLIRGKYLEWLPTATPSVFRTAKNTLGENSLMVIPNPARNKVKIQLSLARPGTGKILIKDVSGKTIRTMEVDHLETGMVYSRIEDISGLAAGVYTVTLSASGVQKTERLVVVK